MTFKKDFARVVWWRYWKQPQTLFVALGHLNYTGFIIPKIQSYEYKNNHSNRNH